MATAVSIPRLPDATVDMASRRMPLATVPNAVNSPVRNVASISGKRTRAQAGDARESTYGQPPTKKQALAYPNEDEENVDPRRRRGVSATAQDKFEEVFSKRSNNSQPTAFERKLASAREKKTTQQPRTLDRTQKQQADNLESIRQWQKHYRRQFPQFVFYFDNVSEDVRHKAMRSIRMLGAREEKFFSKSVTHVVTTRSVPAEATRTSPDDEGKYDGKQDAAQVESAQSTAPGQRRTATLLDAASRRAQQQSSYAHQSIDVRRPQDSGADIIAKARALSIKIWALEKLHRVLDTILDNETGEPMVDTRAANRTSNRATTQDVDLEQLLRHEKVRGPADRDMNVVAQDMVSLRGAYIYIHDMDEKTKPVMVREYQRPQTKEQGKWPQFRLSGPGRCPFIEDPNHAKKAAQDREARTSKAQDLAQRTTRQNAALVEREVNLRRSPRKLAQATNAPMKQTQPAIQPPPTRRQSSAEVTPAFFNSTAANMRGLPRMVRGEPVASGVQPSNVTSAIRSQAISSTAISSTAPGLQRRFGDSKEVSLLKRKVLASNHSVPSSYANDVRAAINDDQCPPPRAAKRKAQETLGVVQEDEDTAEQSRGRATATKRKKVPEKDPKPGYCENCRDKFDDFEDHIASRKHRKFAMTLDNWRDLDALLLQLKRPHKEEAVHRH
ncbi:Hsk1-interacting molecule 1 [Pseudocercospora fuligena]|uniref:Hsk1-interacting molecule 1 n=1 Tax=Pseudocercospora fuligena TaxID=685502 RepID=A0A8H6R5T4_9PEZI|nr:Hsk1-interacting molecule 1 [Pseudocercospora fuligena]